MALRRSGGDTGVVVATVSLPQILDRHIPWWIAAQYAVRIPNGQGPAPQTFVAERARHPVSPGAPFHTISFDPPSLALPYRLPPMTGPRRWATRHF